MSDPTNDHALQEVRAELVAAQKRIAELEHEIEGRRSARSLAHAAAWTPTLFVEAPGAPLDVDDASASAAKLALYRSLFVGRDDVFALRWHSERTGKSGWSPAVRGGWDSRRANP